MTKTLKVRSFAKKELMELAASYAYPKPCPEIKAKSHLSKDQFMAISLWKTERQASRYAMNDAELVEEVTQASFNTKSEEFRIEALRILHGVDYPVASTLLHFGCDSTLYPIIDFRAVWSLYGVEKKAIKYDYTFWNQYRHDCLALSKKHGMSIRELDKALWQYSKLNQRA